MDRFMIAPLQGGLDSSIRPWLITDDSFSRLQNAYIFRGRVRKRFGSRLMNSAVTQSIAQLYSRLRINIGTTNGGTGILSGTVPGIIFDVGQLFSVGSDIFTVWQLGTPATMLSTNPAASGTFNTTTGAFTITDPSQLGVAVYWYPAQPVMGLITYQTATSQNDPTYAFDTQFAYQYNLAGSGAWDILGPIPPATGSAIWTGSDSQFFWGWTWEGTSASTRNLYVVNNNPPDLIKYWNETTAVWTVLNPPINSVGNTLQTALMLVAFKNHLIALSPTINIGGTNTVFTNQARWAKFGDPTATNAWRQDIPGNGNALNAATMEDIVSCEFIKDRLIVFFERSTWELAFTGNQAQPFTWQQINTELGSESTWSVVPFDKIALAIGTTGIHGCNGSNVERIDDKIPDNVWAIHSGNNSTERVYGIRDYYAEQVYWTFPNIDADPNSQVFPNQVLVYNYKTGSWALNDDSITVFGYYYAASESAITWDSLDVTWDNTEITWDSGVAQALNQEILAGNQEGFVFVIDSNQTQNAPVLQITNISLDINNNVTLNVINHNFNVDDFIYIQFLNGLTGPFLPIYQIIAITDANDFIIEAPAIQTALLAAQVYSGGGTIARVSRIDIFTKQFNFYVKEDRNAMINRVDFLVDRTDSGEITINYAMSSANPQSDGVIRVAIASGAITGTSVLETSPYALYPQEALQERVWHPVYLWADGECIQLRIYLSDVEMLNYGVATSAFQLHSYCFYTNRSSARLQ